MENKNKLRGDSNTTLLIVICIILVAILASIFWVHHELTNVPDAFVNYTDFMTKYYEIQSAWLNFALFGVAIIVAFIGIMSALDYKSKRDEINAVKSEVDKIKSSIDDIKNSIDESQIAIAKDLADVKADAEKAKESERKSEANAYYAKASEHCRKEEYPEAINYYNKAIDSNPEFADAYCDRGVAFGIMNKNVEALKDFNTCISLNPNDPVPYDNRGATFSKMNKNVEALDDFNTCISLNPTYAPAYYNRGVTFRRMNKNVEALDDYNTCISLNPTYAAYINRGAVFVSIEQLDKAIDDFKKAIDLDKKDYDAYYNLTEAYIFNLNFKDALDSIRISIEKPKPYIYEDDYEKWMEVLNAHSGEEFVEEIKQIVNERLEKKPRPE